MELQHALRQAMSTFPKLSTMPTIPRLATMPTQPVMPLDYRTKTASTANKKKNYYLCIYITVMIEWFPCCG